MAEPHDERRAVAERHTEDLFRIAVEASPSAMVMIDVSGRIVLANLRTEELFAWPREDLVGREVEVLVPERYRAEHPEMRARFFREPRTRPMGAGRDLSGVRRDGVEFPVEIGLNPIRTPEGSYVLAAIVDITERKRAEERLVETATELARSNADLEQFAYVASHDLQEPLRMVTSYLQLLSRRYRDRLGEDADEFIGYAVDGARRMQRLIEDLLAYSRVGSRGGTFTEVDLRAAAERALHDLDAAVRESGAQVEIDELPVVHADATQIVQLLQNLIANAIKFRGADPPRVRLSAQRRDGGWRVLVEDNGIGVDAEYAERIFGVFQRLHTREDYPGTGIGLAICKRIVERHGGRIGVESRPEKGSTFWVDLPDHRIVR